MTHTCFCARKALHARIILEATTIVCVTKITQTIQTLDVCRIKEEKSKTNPHLQQLRLLQKAKCAQTHCHQLQSLLIKDLLRQHEPLADHKQRPISRFVYYVRIRKNWTSTITKYQIAKWTILLLHLYNQPDYPMTQEFF